MINKIAAFLFLSFVFLFTSTFTWRRDANIAATSLQVSDTTELSLMFIGDIMLHEPQITSAYETKSKIYSYDHCFRYVKDVFEIADLAVANMEFTFGGKPYAGYPQFSAPDEMGQAIKNSGIDVLMLANNHSCDRGKNGILRTIQVVDSLEIPRTGTFRDTTDREKHNPLIIEKKGFRIAFLNYTYDTNGIPVPKPTIVNLIDTALIIKDIQHAKSFDPDEIIVFYHWGLEYERLQNKQQEMLTKVCHDHGARIVIGSHPHVLQPMHRYRHRENNDVELAVVYSLGNFVSNQRERYKDGGTMAYLKLRKYNDIVEIAQMGYILCWVWTPVENGKRKYYIIPVSKYEQTSDFFDAYSLTLFKRFADDSRAHLNKYNTSVPEMKWDTISNLWFVPE